MIDYGSMLNFSYFSFANQPKTLTCDFFDATYMTLIGNPQGARQEDQGVNPQKAEDDAKVRVSNLSVTH